ncbi:hypothetical protein HHI36_019703, partial [Cryptolaemus montrouzieri]
ICSRYTSMFHKTKNKLLKTINDLEVRMLDQERHIALQQKQFCDLENDCLEMEKKFNNEVDSYRQTIQKLQSQRLDMLSTEQNLIKGHKDELNECREELKTLKCVLLKHRTHKSFEVSVQAVPELVDVVVQTEDVEVMQALDMVSVIKKENAKMREDLLKRMIVEKSLINELEHVKAVNVNLMADVRGLDDDNRRITCELKSVYKRIAVSRTENSSGLPARTTIGETEAGQKCPQVLRSSGKDPIEEGFRRHSDKGRSLPHKINIISDNRVNTSSGIYPSIASTDGVHERSGGADCDEFSPGCLDSANLPRTSHRKHVLLLGDQHAYKLKRMLPSVNTVNCSFIKAGAHFAGVTENFTEITKNLTINDSVILIAGSNDFEMGDFPRIRSFCDILKTNTHTNIVVCGIPYNKKKIT